MKLEDLSKQELIAMIKNLRGRLSDSERTLDMMGGDLEMLGDSKDQGELVEIFDDPSSTASAHVATQSIHMAALVSHDITSSGSFDLNEIHRSSYGHFLDAIPMPALTLDNNGEISFANTGFAYISNNFRKLEGKPFRRLFPSPMAGDKAEDLVRAVLVDRKQRVAEGVMEVDSYRLWARIHLRSLRMSSLRYVLALVQDLTPEKKLLHLGKEYQQELENQVKTRTAELKITNSALRSEIEQRRKAQEALRESEQRYRALFDHCPVALWVEDASEVKTGLQSFVQDNKVDETAEENPFQSLEDKGRLVRLIEANKELQKLLGLENVNGSLSRVQDFYRKTPLSCDANKLRALAQGKTTFEGELAFENNQGALVHAALKWSVLPGHEKSYSRLLVSIMDITERKLAEDRIRSSLKEKEALLREIHHRVKNNLQVVSSLLRLQSTYMTDPSTIRVFMETEQRVRSMALAHEQLYQSGDLGELNLERYLTKLINNLEGSSETIGRRISVISNIEPVCTSIDTALPLGCIVTELFSNCMKHAFPNSMEGHINLNLTKRPDDQMELTVKDNGIGLKKSLDLNKPGSLGMDLIGAFTDQLHGNIDFRSDNGTTVTLLFRNIKAPKGRRAHGPDRHTDS